MSMPRRMLRYTCAIGAIGVAVALLTACAAEPSRQSSTKRIAPALGTPVTEAQAETWDRNVFPDGRGLPPGRGTAVEGRPLFERKCASCHGPKGRGATAEELAGEPTSLSGPHPDKNIGSYWPFATTIFDFTRRAMPMNAPGSLSADELYAVTAYLLYINRVIGEHDEMNATTLPRVRMPNRDGFIWIDARPQPGAKAP